MTGVWRRWIIRTFGYHAFFGKHQQTLSGRCQKARLCCKLLKTELCRVTEVLDRLSGAACGCGVRY